MTEIPNDRHVTYQLQYRRCGRAACKSCKTGPGHGPYWYAYWYEGPRLRAGYVGKKNPSLQSLQRPVPTTGYTGGGDAA